MAELVQARNGAKKMMKVLRSTTTNATERMGALTLLMTKVQQELASYVITDAFDEAKTNDTEISMQETMDSAIGQSAEVLEMIISKAQEINAMGSAQSDILDLVEHICKARQRDGVKH